MNRISFVVAAAALIALTGCNTRIDASDYKGTCTTNADCTLVAVGTPDELCREPNTCEGYGAIPTSALERYKKDIKEVGCNLDADRLSSCTDTSGFIAACVNSACVAQKQ